MKSLAAIFAVLSIYAGQGVQLDQQDLMCLAKNVYFESRSESLLEQFYVANVTMNRVADKRWPASVCEVVYQPWQFSWTTKEPDLEKSIQNPIDGLAWQQAVGVAGLVLSKRVGDMTRRAVFFHHPSVSPKWAESKSEVLLGNTTHRFYR